MEQPQAENTLPGCLECSSMIFFEIEEVLEVSRLNAAFRDTEVIDDFKGNLFIIEFAKNDALSFVEACPSHNRSAD